MEKIFAIRNGKSTYRFVFLGTLAVVLSLIFFLPKNNSEISISLFSTCAIDNVIGGTPQEGTWVVPPATEIIAQGWAGDPIKSSKASEIFLELVDSENNVIKTVRNKSDFLRPDVASAYGNAAMEFTGFNFGLGKIETPGDYSILVGHINEGQVQICTIPFKLKMS
jgi:hypothetical protein